MDGVTCTGRGFQVKRLKSLGGWGEVLVVTCTSGGYRWNR